MSLVVFGNQSADDGVKPGRRQLTLPGWSSLWACGRTCSRASDTKTH